MYGSLVVRLHQVDYVSRVNIFNLFIFFHFLFGGRDWFFMVGFVVVAFVVIVIAELMLMFNKMTIFDLVSDFVNLTI